MRGAGRAGCEAWGVSAGAGGASGLDRGGAQALHRARAPAAQDAGRRHAPGRRARSARSALHTCIRLGMLMLWSAKKGLRSLAVWQALPSWGMAYPCSGTSAPGQPETSAV